MKSKDTLQQIADRINSSLEFYPFADNLEEIEVYTNSKTQKQSLMLYWSGFVTLNMLNTINEELGTNINYVFHNSDRLNTIIHLEEVIIR